MTSCDKVEGDLQGDRINTLLKLPDDETIERYKINHCIVVYRRKREQKLNGLFQAIRQGKRARPGNTKAQY
eukprot:scaffold329_cov390-Pavlova_lutheri.AAC.8